MTWPRPGSALPQHLAEAINLHVGSVTETPPEPVSEESLSFRCLHGDHSLPASDAAVSRTASAVIYRCPYDGAQLVSIGHGDYAFSEGELMIEQGDDTISWWDYLQDVNA